ncbi:MAG: hypothetical protein IJT62_02060 [Oscillospiraceae bacterium]|nr:hypothetical protein [Oscillospiraceae bacterium]
MLAFSFLFIAVVSVYNTPLNSYYGYDSAFFLLIGKGIRQGLLPYLDLYDQKGPMIFYINALGYALTGSRFGVFLLQVLSFFVSLLWIKKISRNWLQSRDEYMALFVFCFVFCGTVQEGNMTEEWSLPFLIRPLLLSLQFLRRNRRAFGHPLRYSLIYGVCFGVLFMFRATNTAPLCGLILAFIIMLIKEKKPLDLCKNAVTVILGMMLVVTPFLVYFARVGALDSFMEASLFHNFHYAVGGASSKTLLDWLVILARVFPILMTLCVSPFLRKASAESFPVLLTLNCVGLAGAAAMTLGYGYRHYYLILAPIITADYALLIEYITTYFDKNRLKALIILCTVLFLVPFAPQFVRQVGKAYYYDIYHSLDGDAARYKQLNEYIPAGTERVWGYNYNAQIYLYTDLMPCYRYFALQEWMAEAQPEIMDEIDDMLQNDPPEWIFLRSSSDMTERLENEFSFERVAVIENRYDIAIYRYVGGSS